jgi:hypothetical protein
MCCCLGQQYSNSLRKEDIYGLKYVPSADQIARVTESTRIVGLNSTEGIQARPGYPVLLSCESRIFMTG